MNYNNPESNINVYEVAVLREILNKSAKESISEEQIFRVLEPILIMIRKGIFYKPNKTRFIQLIKQTFSNSNKYA